MKINKQSWHYRFLRSIGIAPKDNLCPYVRQVLGNMIGMLGVIIFLLCLAGALTYPIWQIYTGTDTWIAILSAVANVWVFGGMLYIYREDFACYPKAERFGPAVLHTDLFAWTPKRAAKVRKPSVTSAYLRAVHDKVCPEIDFVSNDDES